MADTPRPFGMGKAWVKRWSPKVPKGKGSLVHALRVHPPDRLEAMQWDLPPSKSHAIRWLVLAAQSAQETILHGMQDAGQDVVSMRRCLTQLGVSFTDLDSDGAACYVASNVDDQPSPNSVAWKVHGVGKDGLHPPVSVLHAGNSGTTLRLLMALVAQFDVPVMLDGDASLRSRRYPAMLEAMDQLGVKRSHGLDEEGLPLLLEGPVPAACSLNLDISKSSQPLTAWLLTAPSRPATIELRAKGTPVSRRHSQLSMDLCERTGAPDTLSETVGPWEVNIPQNQVGIPRDASMLAFAYLASVATGARVQVSEFPAVEESLGHEVLMEHARALGVDLTEGSLTSNGNGAYLDLDLRDANDLITPVAAMMALGAGGVLRGAAHAAHKETNRLSGTQAMLNHFGIRVNLTPDGMEIPGGQQLRQPEGMVPTFGDHRLQMTALNLAMGCQKEVLIEGSSLHTVADPTAVDRWQAAGVEIEAFLHQPS